ncbi:amidase [Marinobacter sp. F4206]|uniref:amidase n=1 Tax=Marinobacter sp. F4206 TaxID=2861777 RepID=UPI001C5CEA47|nr:amidase [Marinobacter sp. F4206]MBW4935983.1 amidase [Marinobacter sp. F4206]
MAASTVPRSVHAFTNDALGTDDATALADRIRRRDVSAVELAEAAISRAQAVDLLIGGLVASDYDKALEAARRIDTQADRTAAGFFAGVPTVIKDNTDIQGLPSGHGSAAVPASVSDRTSPFALQMLDQGYVCLGKSALPEFGFNATTEPAHRPPSRNPWNLAFSTGASSGGAAALVAAGVVPVAHANDGGGSIRIPAACCGLVGLKPSRGRLIDNDAARTLPVNIITDGIVSRSVRDTAHFMEQAEKYFHRPGLPAIGRNEGPSGEALTIGLVLDSVNGHATDDDTRRTVENTAHRLERLGHRIVPMDVPVAASFPEDFALYWAFLAFGVKANGRKLIHPGFDKDHVDGLTEGLAGKFKKQFYRLPAALWRLHRSYHHYARAMAGFDAVLTPVLGHTTPAIGHLSPNVPFSTLFERLTRYVGFTPLANATGAPAISLPMGLNRDNLPVSVQFMGQHGGERTLLDIAYTLESEMPWPALHETSGDSQTGMTAETML